MNAPLSTIQQSRTAQATLHVAGAVALLRARGPAEALAAGFAAPTIIGRRGCGCDERREHCTNVVLAAVDQATALSLTGSGPTPATAGASTRKCSLSRTRAPSRQSTWWPSIRCRSARLNVLDPDGQLLYGGLRQRVDGERPDRYCLPRSLPSTIGVPAVNIDGGQLLLGAMSWRTRLAAGIPKTCRACVVRQ